MREVPLVRTYCALSQKVIGMLDHTSRLATEEMPFKVPSISFHRAVRSHRPNLKPRDVDPRPPFGLLQAKLPTPSQLRFDNLPGYLLHPHSAALLAYAHAPVRKPPGRCDPDCNLLSASINTVLGRTFEHYGELLDLRNTLVSNLYQ